MKRLRHGKVLLIVMLACPVVARALGPMTFEEAAYNSDRVVVGTVIGPVGDQAQLPDGTSLTLGFLDPGSNKVFTRYRINVTECVFDADASCALGASEILIPGGTVWRTVNGESRLQRWEVARMPGLPFEASSSGAVLFMRKVGTVGYQPLNDSGARLPVISAGGAQRVKLTLSSRRNPSEPGSALGNASLGSSAYGCTVHRYRIRRPTQDTGQRREGVIPNRTERGQSRVGARWPSPLR